MNWRVQPDPKHPTLAEIVNAEGPVLDEGFKISDENEMAKAHLIAAAPEMLDALEALLEVANSIDADQNPHHLIKDLTNATTLADKAIAKARGEK